MTRQPITAIATTLALFGSAAVDSSASASEVFFDFSEAGQYTDNFTESGTSSGSIEWSGGPGVGGEAGLVTKIDGNNNRTSWYNETWNLNAGTFEASVFFRGIEFIDGTGGANRQAIGLDDSFKNMVGSSDFNVRLIRPSGSDTARFEVRNADAGNSNTTGIKLAMSNWYKMSITVSRIENETSFSVAGVLEDWGADGTTAPSSPLGTASGTFTDADLFDNDGNVLPLYAGMMVENNNGGGADAFDNFQAVPEPASFGLLGAGVLLMLGRRRR